MNRSRGDGRSGCRSGCRRSSPSASRSSPIASSNDDSVTNVSGQAASIRCLLGHHGARRREQRRQDAERARRQRRPLAVAPQAVARTNERAKRTASNSTPRIQDFFRSSSGHRAGAHRSLLGPCHFCHQAHRAAPTPRSRAAQARARRRGPDPARHWRHHRHRHLRADRPGGRRARRPGRRAVDDRRRHCQRARRDLLCRVRLVRAGRRLGLHLRLRHARRARGVDHRLGPGARVRARRRDGRGGLVGLRRVVPRRPRHSAFRRCSAPRPARRSCWPTASTRDGALQPAGDADLRGGDRAAGDRHPRIGARQRRDRRRSRWRSCC